MALKEGHKLVHKFLVNSQIGGIDAIFDTGGTGTGASTGLTHFGHMTAGPSTGKVWVITRMIVNIKNDGTPWNSTEYGSITGLTNGVKIGVFNSSTPVYYLGGTTAGPIKQNFDWTRVCYDFNPMSFGARNPMVGRWTFSKSGKSVKLDGDANENIRAVFTESTTGILGHTFQIQGYEIDK
jgi:hypothetical protein